jgi:hypothetical protein
VKKEKVPLKMLQGMKKKQKEREEKQIQEQKDHGIYVKKNAGKIPKVVLSIIFHRTS